jgi:hypothetical protein
METEEIERLGLPTRNWSNRTTACSLRPPKKRDLRAQIVVTQDTGIMEPPWSLCPPTRGREGRLPGDLSTDPGITQGLRFLLRSPVGDQLGLRRGDEEEASFGIFARRRPGG